MLVSEVVHHTDLHHSTVWLNLSITAAGCYLNCAVILCARDLKPGNILLNSSGVAKIADFGISRMKAATYLKTQHAEVGTVAYMAPECFSSEWGISEKSDVYSLGVILWECVTGQRPWSEYGHQMAIVFQVVQCDRRLPFPK